MNREHRRLEDPTDKPQRRTGIRLMILTSLLVVLGALAWRTADDTGWSGRARSGSGPIADQDDAEEGIPGHDGPTILFVGNSHTSSHQLSQLVLDLIQHRLGPDSASARYHPVSFLDEGLGDPALIRKIKSGRWKTVVLQAQKISSSGRYSYPTDEGVQLAQLAIEHGCKPCFFSEWGIRDVPDHTVFTENIYRSMAEESGGILIPVGRVWESVLAADPGLPLYGPDLNHQTRLGASLTALVLAAWLLEEPASAFAGFEDPVADDSQWQLFLEKLAEIQASTPVPAERQTERQ